MVEELSTQGDSRTLLEKVKEVALMGRQMLSEHRGRRLRRPSQLDVSTHTPVPGPVVGALATA